MGMRLRYEDKKQLESDDMLFYFCFILLFFLLIQSIICDQIRWHCLHTFKSYFIRIWDWYFWVIQSTNIQKPLEVSWFLVNSTTHEEKDVTKLNESPHTYFVATPSTKANSETQLEEVGAIIWKTEEIRASISKNQL